MVPPQAIPCLDLDVEAQTNSVSETQPAMIPDPLLPPSTPNTVNPQLPTTADLQPQTTNTDQYHNENSPAQQAAENSEAQRGLFSFPFHQLQSHSCIRRELRRLFRWGVVNVPD